MEVKKSAIKLLKPCIVILYHRWFKILSFKPEIKRAQTNPQKKRKPNWKKWKRTYRRREWWRLWGWFKGKIKDCGKNAAGSTNVLVLIYFRPFPPQSAHFFIGCIPFHCTFHAVMTLGTNEDFWLQILNKFNIGDCRKSRLPHLRPQNYLS